jgi:simple sugar transport system ATP-binding protein
VSASVATPVVPRLELRGIRKAYPAVVANDGIDLIVEPGEIHAVLGENGAGKSTLVKIVYGVVQPDAGEIRWDGRPVRIAGPQAARRLGIGMVFQHFSLFETLTVVENVALGLDGERDLTALARRIEAVSERYGLPIDPSRPVHSLAVGQRQRVEIVRCLLGQPRLLIMDEPTSVLTPQAVERLFDTLRRLAGEGCSILYISHKLDEIRALCSRATVLRAGRVTGECDPRRETAATLARLMIGAELPAFERETSGAPGEARLEVAGLTVPAADPFGVDLRDVELTVHAGEIVGIAGVSGNGQQELLAALSGETLVDDAAAVRMLGRPVGRAAPGPRRGLGLAFVPEERLGRGAVPTMSLTENALLTAHRQGMVRLGFARLGIARAFAAACIERFGVRSAGPQAPARSLSGGNLQKFIVGREIGQKPRLLIVAQPTWGVDVGAALLIRQELRELRRDGVAILVVSDDLDELFELCDRIAVMTGGRLSPARPVAGTTVEAIGLLMGGSGAGAAGAGREDPAVAAPA